jgi:hypothetical protein
MNVQSVGLNDAISSTAGSAKFFLPGAEAFADSLNIGQILQGRVLREYEGNRYLVAFGKDERVVDSTLPLSAGEILHGRVVGLGDRVELQRVLVRERDSTPPQTSATEARAPRAANEQGLIVDALFQRYQIPLSEADRAALLRAVRNAADGEVMSLAGAMLGKLGLPQAGVLLDALYQAQLARARTPAPPPAPARELLPEVVASPAQQVAEWQTSSIRSLANLLGRIAELHSQSERGPVPSQSQSAAVSADGLGSLPGLTQQKDVLSDGQARDNAQAALAQRILNAQTGGVVSHRSGYLPLIVGGSLVEVSFALFEQQQQPAARSTGLQHRQVIFSLRTEHLGQVDVVARITGGHVRVQLLTGSEENTSEASRHAGALTQALTESGWSVDEIAYGTRAPGGQDATVRSVIEHVISLDSLNRLV